MIKITKALLVAAAGAALLVAGGPEISQPAHAQFGLFIPHIGGFYGGGRGCRHCGGGGGRRSRGDSDDSGSSNAQNDRADRTVSSAPPATKDQNEVLHNIAQLNVEELANAGSGDGSGTSKSISPLGKAVSKEQERDWTQKVQDIINKFKSKAQNEGRGVTTPGDVTEHAIEQSLESAIKNAKLSTFETFLGENWSGERLRVMVLDRVEGDIDSLFRGNTRGYAPMQEVDSLIQRAAQLTYRRIFEVSELLAANRSSALFVQRLYQAQNGAVSNQLREVADEMISHASGDAVGKFESALRQDPNGFALRYRAQRIVFDCLSENVEHISSSETAAATIGEIRQRIADTGGHVCVSWLDNQFGADPRSIVEQKPLPLRVVWSEGHFKDDASMYGRATDDF
jgi:hypothetical protein